MASRNQLPATPWPTKSKLWFVANFQVYHLRTFTNQQLFLLNQEKHTSSRNFDHTTSTPWLFCSCKQSCSTRVEQSSSHSLCKQLEQRHWSEGVFLQASTPSLRETSFQDQRVPTSTLSNSSELWLWAHAPPPVGGKRQELQRGTPKRNT